MKCPHCSTDNKDAVKACRKCGAALAGEAWRPTWKWHLKTLSIIYAALIAVFFLMNFALKPYMRTIPSDLTPWLKEVPKNVTTG